MEILTLTLFPNACTHTRYPSFKTKPWNLRNTLPVERILMGEAHVAGAFTKVRVEPDQAHTSCYTVGDLVVIDCRLTFG